MRWKLLVGLAITWFGLGITGLFQHAGIIPLDTPLFWTLMGPAVLEVLPAMLFHCSGKCVDGFCSRPAVLDRPRNLAGVPPAQRLAGQMGFAEIARADAKFFDRACGEGIGKQGAQTDHTQCWCTKWAFSHAKNIKTRIQ